MALLRACQRLRLSMPTTADASLVVVATQPWHVPDGSAALAGGFVAQQRAYAAASALPAPGSSSAGAGSNAWRGCVAGSAALGLGLTFMAANSGPARAEVSAPPAAGGPAEPAPLDGPFQLPKLPYTLDALEPYMSGSTLAVHWGKHHRTYLDNLNKQVAGGPLAGQALEQVVKATWNNGRPTPAFNNAAQSWNHEFFWSSMKPGGGGAPKGELAEAFVRDFEGGLDGFKAAFKAAGLGQFGSGWVWLVSDPNGKLSIIKTSNAVTPLVSGWHCLMVADVWEHAYYLDYQNRRADFLETFLAHLVDWGAVEERYAAAMAESEEGVEEAA